MQPISADALIVGAGPAGLACGACLKQIGIEPVLLEKEQEVGPAWRQHYDRLHLHTDRAHSGLPGLPMPRAFARYPARADVIGYLESYARHFGLAPVFGTDVTRIESAGPAWSVAANGKTWRSNVVIVATGLARIPVRPAWAERGFAGTILHSGEYRNPAAFAGRKVLVVGFGNSAAEIALDLALAGVDVALSVRGPVCIVPRDLFGVPILTWSILLRRLPPRLADRIGAPLRHLALGSLRRFGLEPAPHGPLTMIRERRRIPVLDIGTLAAIRSGAIGVRGDVRALEAGEVVFADGGRETFDAIILATGYRPDLRALLSGVSGVLDSEGVPLVSGAATAQPGLYFCGLTVSPTGQLREIGRESRRIAALVGAARMRVAA
jgi:cation diffusion facilitator CzcD-associated flavoprotein CzcO